MCPRISPKCTYCTWKIKILEVLANTFKFNISAKWNNNKILIFRFKFTVFILLDLKNFVFGFRKSFFWKVEWKIPGQSLLYNGAGCFVKKVNQVITRSNRKGLFTSQFFHLFDMGPIRSLICFNILDLCYFLFFINSMYFRHFSLHLNTFSKLINLLLLNF